MLQQLVNCVLFLTVGLVLLILECGFVFHALNHYPIQPKMGKGQERKFLKDEINDSKSMSLLQFH